MLRHLDKCPLSTSVVFHVKFPPLSSRPHKCPRELSFWVSSNVVVLLNPALGCCNAEMLGSHILAHGKLISNAPKLYFPS